LEQAHVDVHTPATEPFGRVLLPTAPAKQYRRRRGETKSVLHWGQRKLLLAEIEFLSIHGVDGATVVYAGAAPGTHVPILAKLFPKTKFVLFDPRPFGFEEASSIRLRQEYFTDDTAKEFAGRKDILFISDVRTVDWKENESADIERCVWNDMLDQQRWHDMMKPRKSMLKFRLPWTAGTSEYLDGDLYLPVWGPQTTTETRLVPHGHTRKQWDNTHYEGQMFHFNTVTRQQCYAHTQPCKDAEGIDHCYDCTAEIDILRRVTDHVADFSRELSALLSGGRRTLADPQPPPEPLLDASSQKRKADPSSDTNKRTKVELVK
jgi:cap2 methyltransferase